jgi:hypothetical protein
MNRMLILLIASIIASTPLAFGMQAIVPKLGWLPCFLILVAITFPGLQMYALSMAKEMDYALWNRMPSNPHGSN